MKVCVYAIAKNESKFVDRWVKSMSEADEISVLDTGSDDETVKLLEERGVRVRREVLQPFRFDIARNIALNEVAEDADICISTDLDEAFEPGWRAAMEKAWRDGVNQLKYRYTWSFLPDGSEGYVFWIAKAHARHGFKWTHPVHEVLEYEGGQPSEAYAVGVQLNHYPDNEKSRGSYLPLLELSVKERPYDDRNVHYLGREYMYYGQYDKAIKTLKRHLSLPTANWADERAASMRFISRCYIATGNLKEGEKYILKAIAEAPELREAWVDASKMYLNKKDWLGAAFCANKALAIKNRSMSYINEPDAWGYAPYDCLAIAMYYLGNKAEALQSAERALELNSTNKRLQDNRRLIADKINKSDYTFGGNNFHK
ncbi:MAG: tetratricopeptide repeat protein [Clostridia bacterium]|nr:tetratricopeptide repeat protein [Clostridia bacterium]